MVIKRNKNRELQLFSNPIIRNLKSFFRETRIRKKNSKKPIIQELVFNGYHKDTTNIPAQDGIYVAFARKEGDTPSQYKRMYIGIGTGTDHLNNRIGDHINNDHNTTKWLDHYDPAIEEIVYSYAVMNDVSRILEVENILIFKSQPLVNDEYRYKISSSACSVTLNIKGAMGSLCDRYYWDMING